MESPVEKMSKSLRNSLAYGLELEGTIEQK